MPDLWSELHPNDPVPKLKPSAYPKWVNAPSGRMIVNSKAEELMVMGGAQIETKPPVNHLMPPQPELPEKSRLQLQAQQLGIDIDRRWGEKKLRKVIQEHS